MVRKGGLSSECGAGCVSMEDVFVSEGNSIRGSTSEEAGVELESDR